MKKFTIAKRERRNDHYHQIEFQAVDHEGKDIFAADATLSRSKDFRTDEWEPWKLNYGSSGAKDYETSRPYIEVLNKAFDELYQLNK